MFRKSKIKDNPTYAELNRELKTAKAIYRLIKFLESIGIKNRKLSEAFAGISELADESQRLSNVPDKFNKHYSKRGWVAFESINAELMEKAVEAAERGRTEEGEALLIEYFSDKDHLTSLLWMMSGIPAFRLRRDLTEKALSDFIEGRYHASIPVVLLVLDGLVNDVEPTGFFAKQTDVTAWDSIAGHSTGLKTLTKLMQRTRKKTITDEIDIPYRHGIMHGRDLGYANKIVATKTWAALFAIGDWVRAKAEAPKKRLRKSEKRSWSDLFNTIRETEELERKLEEWKPREIIIGKDIPKTGTPLDFDNRSPEAMVAMLFDYWGKRNYGGMASLEIYFKNTNINERAGEIRVGFRNKELTGFEITNIEDKAPGITEIQVIIGFTQEGVFQEVEKAVRLVYQDAEGNPKPRGDPLGSWKVILFFL